MPDSLGSLRPRPSAVSSAACNGLSCQLSFVLKSAPLLLCSTRVGSAKPSGIPNCAREGPIPRKATFLGALPATINPPITTLLPASTCTRVEMFRARAGGEAVAEAVAVGVGLAVGVAVAVGVGDGQKPQHVLTNTMLSIRHPGAAPALSVPMRKRNLTVCPFICGPN